jgi:hypothetical protein
MLRILDVYTGSRIRIFPSRIPDPGPKRSRIRIRIKELKYFKTKIRFKLWEKLSELFILGPVSGSGFFSIPDPDVKKEPDPGSGSATLVAKSDHDLNNKK